MSDDSILKNRFEELAQRAMGTGRYVFSDFLTVDEQSVLQCMRMPCGFVLYGGYDMPERAVACFGDFSFEADVPIDIIKAEPKSQKFAGVITHRDVLGSVMGLGIRRETIGDIIVADSCAYIFCLERISGYIIEKLDKIARTAVVCKRVSALPESAVIPPVQDQITAASLRLDAIISAVFKLSRGNAQSLIKQGKAFVNGRNVLNSSFLLGDNSIVSLRGSGRVKVLTVIRHTKKDKSVVSILRY